MFSARALMRSAPRALHRIARPATIARPSTLLRAQYTPASSRISAFSTSLLRKSSAGSVDAELSTKLGAEMQFETSVKETEDAPVSVKDFLDNSPFDIKDVQGMQDVVLTRAFGNETITITFSIADLADLEQNSFDEEQAMADEDGDLTDEMANRGHQEAAGEEGEGEGEDAEGSSEPSVTCRLNIVVEKDNQGALNIDASVQDGAIIVENMYYYKDAAIAHSATPEAVHKERDVYPGPAFGTLDEDLQQLMEQYLDERGINSTLAVFVPDYMDLKEHREYMAWLQNVKKFIDA